MSKPDPHPPQSPPPANPPPPAVERITGHGKVLRDGQSIMDVDYDLTISLPSDRKSAVQRMHVRDRDEPVQESQSSDRPPYLDIAGRLLSELYTGEHLLGVHTLVLEDGRELDFRVVQPDTNEIIGVSDVRPHGQQRNSQDSR